MRMIFILYVSIYLFIKLFYFFVSLCVCICVCVSIYIYIYTDTHTHKGDCGLTWLFSGDSIHFLAQLLHRSLSILISKMSEYYFRYSYKLFLCQLEVSLKIWLVWLSEMGYCLELSYAVFTNSNSNNNKNNYKKTSIHPPFPLTNKIPSTKISNMLSKCWFWAKISGGVEDFSRG